MLYAVGKLELSIKPLNIKYKQSELAVRVSQSQLVRVSQLELVSQSQLKGKMNFDECKKLHDFF